MQSQHFDALTRRAAKLSRRDVLRWCGVAALSLFASKLSTRFAAAKSSDTLPPPYEPWSPENPPPGFDELIDDYLDCIVKLAREEQIPVDPNKFDQCDRGFPGFDWCQIVWDVLTEAMPNLAGFASTFTPFSRNCGDRDCFQCCYRPSSGSCHSSFIGFPVINCNPNTYGEGTKPAGLTFIIDPSNVKPEDSCLFIPQVCSHIALCVSGVGALADGFALAPVADNYLTDARAIDQRARVFAMQAQSALRAYLENYATNRADARPIHTLLEALLGRGSAGWRSGLRDHPIDITHAALRINDAAGNVITSASWANAAGLMALARLLAGIPNLFARLASVESKVWSAADKSAYLTQVGDADAALQQNLDAHFVAALSDIGMLQDAHLLAVPLAGEAVADGTYGGLTLGKAPIVQLSADTQAQGAPVTLQVTVEDAEDAVAQVSRAIAVDWGDGQVTHLTLATGLRQLETDHSYAKAGRYAIYAVAAGDSGLRGHAALVIETSTNAAPSRIAAAMPAIAQLRMDALTINFLGFTKRCVLTARLAGDDGLFWPAGRTVQANGPTNITVPVAMGDLFIHNPARYPVTRLRLEPRIDMAVPSSSSRVPNVQLSALTFGVFSTATQTLVEKTMTLTASQLKLYLPNATTALPEDAVVVANTGALQVPLFWRAMANDPWQTIDRIEINLSGDVLADMDVNATPTPLAPCTRGTWAETRPGMIQAVQFRQFMPRLNA